MGRTWQLQEAKNKLSELVERSSTEGPQQITKRGEPAAVVISAKDYERLKRGKESLVDFFRNSPLRGIAFERTRDFPREIKL